MEHWREAKPCAHIKRLNITATILVVNFVSLSLCTARYMGLQVWPSQGYMRTVTADVGSEHYKESTVIGPIQDARGERNLEKS